MNNSSDNERNEFDKEIDELKEWQENRFNPGYFIGTGRIAKPISNLSKYPWVIIIFGVFCLIPVFFLFTDFSMNIENVVNRLIPMILSLCIGGALIYGGIIRLIIKKRAKKS